MKLWLYRLLKDFFDGRWNRAYWFFVERFYSEINNQYGTQSNQAWDEGYKGYCPKPNLHKAETRLTQLMTKGPHKPPCT